MSEAMTVAEQADKYEPFLLEGRCPHRDRYGERCGKRLTLIVRVPAGDIDVTDFLALGLTCWECGTAVLLHWSAEKIAQARAAYRENGDLFA